MPAPIVPVASTLHRTAAPVADIAAQRVVPTVDPGARGERGARLLRAPYTPSAELAPPRVHRVADIRHNVSWQVGLPTVEATRAFFQVLLDHRDAINIDGIALGSFNGGGREPTRMLTIPLVTVAEHQEGLRAQLMDVMHDSFGVPRYDDVRARALELPLNPCIVETVDPEAVRAMLRSGVLDEDLISTIFQRRGPLPPYIDPAAPYGDAGDIKPDPDKNPACQVA